MLKFSGNLLVSPYVMCATKHFGYYMMRRLLWSIFVLVSLLIFIGLTSCIDGGDQERPGMAIDTELLVSKIWSVTFFGDNGQDETSQFSDVYLQFLPNLRLAIIQGCETWEGEWIISPDSTLLVIRMPDNTPPPLDQLEDEWIITKLTDNNLIIIEQDDKGDEEFHMQTAPLRALSCVDCSDFTNVLTDSVWSVTVFENSQVTQADALKGFYLQFFPDGTFVASSDSYEASGEWAVTDNCQKLVLEWTNDALTENVLVNLAREWIILEYDMQVISVESDDEAGFRMVMKKGRFPNCDELTTSLHNTSWFISKFTINGDVVTPQFTGTGLTFLPNNQLATEVIIGPAVLGGWLLAGECDILILDIQAGILTELSREWTIMEINDQVIKLVYEENTLRMVMHLTRGNPAIPTACVSIINAFTNKSWTVASFLDNGTEDTEKFEGYHFNFNLDGSLLINNPNNDDVTGSWSLIRGCQVISLDIGNSGPFDEINHQWYIESYNDYEIVLVYSNNDKNQELVLVHN